MYDFITVDFETANLYMNSACSIGIVAVKDLDIVKKEYFLIKPPSNKFDSENIAIHGITYEDVKDCDNFDVLWESIKHYFEEIVIAHNAQFDMSVLKNLLDTYNIECPNFIYVDSIAISNSICNCGTGLKDRAEYLGVDLTNHHNALDDSLACAMIVINSVKGYGSKSFLHFALEYNRLLQKEFCNIKTTKLMPGKSLKRFPSVKISELTAATNEVDADHLFYNKNIVVTGEFDSYSRKELMQKIVNIGGVIKSSVTKVTDILIVGTQDNSIVGVDGMSNKEERAYELNRNGYSIKILNETELLKLIKDN